ncbi:uncharacterized protein [Apostichopus japonicus]|uniref:uncharacterized protein isoform X2 n=1 Tax=Stichopus japonicus TaxID=307972 RepID=UPI003AB21381
MTIDSNYQMERITPEMQRAINNGDGSTVELLLTKGANPGMVEKDIETGYQQSLLIKSITYRHHKIAKMLLRYGAKSNISFMNYDNDSLSIQEMTAKKMAQLVYTDTKDLEIKEIIERLNKDKDQFLRVPPDNFPEKLPPQLLIEAVRQGDIFLTRLLLNKGMDVNLLDKCRDSGYQVSILVSSISRCHENISKLLVEKGAQTDVVFLNYEEKEDCLSKVTALSAAIDERDKNPKNIQMAEIVELLQRKIDESQQSQTSIVVAANVPEALRPNVAPSRLFQPRNSVFKIPEIMIESVDSDNEEDNFPKDESKTTSTNTVRTKHKRKPSSIQTTTKTDKRKPRKNRRQSEICTIL